MSSARPPAGERQAGAGPDEPPPLLGSWRRLYMIVAVELALTVMALYALTRWAT